MCAGGRDSETMDSFLFCVFLSRMISWIFSFSLTHFLLSFPLDSLIFLAFSSLWKVLNSFLFLFLSQWREKGEEGKASKVSSSIAMVGDGG